VTPPPFARLETGTVRVHTVAEFDGRCVAWAYLGGVPGSNPPEVNPFLL